MINSRLNREYRSAVSALVSVVLFLSVAGSIGATGVPDDLETAGAEVRYVTDGTGREVEIPAYPKRIVAAGRATLMVADGL